MVIAKEPLCFCFCHFSLAELTVSGPLFPLDIPPQQSPFPSLPPTMFLLPLPDFLWSQGQASFSKPQMVASKSYPYPSLPATSELALGWGRMWSGKLIMFPFPNLPCRVAKTAREWQGLRVLRTELEEGTVLSRGIVARGDTSP